MNDKCGVIVVVVWAALVVAGVVDKDADKVTKAFMLMLVAPPATSLAGVLLTFLMAGLCGFVDASLSMLALVGGLACTAIVCAAMSIVLALNWLELAFS